jgi:prepilin-type N-terminal cleavage/methylation domain-containing protein
VAKGINSVRGVTLIELLVALAVSALLISLLYRTFLGQQRTYLIQEDVVNMRQNARGAISRMIQEIRMAGFGNVDAVLPLRFNAGETEYRNVVNFDHPRQGLITIVTAISSRAASLTGSPSADKITVSKLDDFAREAGGKRVFDERKKYISIGGIESNVITGIQGNEISLGNPMNYKHPVGTRVYPIRAVTYSVTADGALARSDQISSDPISEEKSIERIDYEALDGQGNSPGDDRSIRVIRVTVTAKTDEPDPQLKSGGGYRRRQISSNIQLRNLSGMQ